MKRQPLPPAAELPPAMKGTLKPSVCSSVRAPAPVRASTVHTFLDAGFPSACPTLGSRSGTSEKRGGRHRPRVCAFPRRF